MEQSCRKQHRFIYEYLKALDCPRSLAVWLLYSSKEHLQLATLAWDPHDYSTVVAARDSLAATKFLSKAEFLTTGLNLREEALKKFRDAEDECRLTNRRIRSSQFEKTEAALPLFVAARKISYILGSIPTAEIFESCDWGPGATTSIPRRRATHPNKYEIESRITASAYELVKDAFPLAYPNWDITFEVSDWNKVVTVPKDAKSDRTIAIEPGINLWFQKGIGTVIRRRLKRHGIDLNDQSHNARLSRIGAKFNNLATVDFSNASDTISTALVERLLPTDWFTMLGAFRSKYGQLDGSLIEYEKFSSMGNGFTFELESLIFYALAVACCDLRGVDSSSVSVFGDDVIIPSEVFDYYASVCALLGFTVNRRKSYSSSYYRESCGAHYWNGVDIKPIFQKEPLHGRAQIIKAANNVRRLAHRRNSFGCDRALRRCWTLLAGLAGRHAPRISEGYGDSGLIENLDGPRVVATRCRYGLEGFIVRAWCDLPSVYTTEGKGLLLFKLKQIGSREAFDALNVSETTSKGNDVALPGRTHVVKLRLHVPRWYYLGPWI